MSIASRKHLGSAYNKQLQNPPKKLASGKKPEQTFDSFMSHVKEDPSFPSMQMKRAVAKSPKTLMRQELEKPIDPAQLYHSQSTKTTKR